MLAEIEVIEKGINVHSHAFVLAAFVFLHVYIFIYGYMSVCVYVPECSRGEVTPIL